MPDHEFDIYLTMLSQLLRLQPGQREEIADELRDHLEERLAELTDAGVPHDVAVRRALEEFGDAAGLAADFTRISRQRTRRTLMRWTLGTAVVTTVAVFLATAFWPSHPGAPQGPGAKAQQNIGFGNGGDSGTGASALGNRKPRVSRTVSRRENTELEKKLATKLEKVGWDSVMFKDVLAQVSDNIKVDIVIDKNHFSDNDYSLDAPVTLSLNNTKVSARTALELAIERANLKDVAVTFRDGFVYLTGRDNDKHVEVYDCSSLLKTVAMRRFGGAGMADDGGAASGDGFGKGAAGAGAPMGAASGGFGPGGSGGPMHGASAVAATSRGQQLINVIRTTITSTDWVGFRGMGGGASIAEFNGMLVITASRSAHRDIKQLLERLREVATKKK